MKFGKRLQALLTTIANAASDEKYDEIWDCCCDHGYLGMAILENRICSKVHFVDQVAHIILALETQLKRFSPECYTTTTDSAANIQPDPSKKHLIILAGIGGKTAIDILQAIHQPFKRSYAGNKPLNISYLLSPNHHLYEVRDVLIQEGLHLVTESVVSENKKTYEIILVSTRKPENHSDEEYQPLSPVGEMWDNNDPHQLHHLQVLIHYYQTKFDNTGSSKTLTTLNLYKQLTATAPR